MPKPAADLLDPGQAVVIANPAAAGGRVGRDRASLAAMLRGHLGPVDLRWTESSGHATALAAAAVEEGAREILSLGGDGTHNEVTCGIVQGMAAARLADGAVTLSILPSGTGGDFRRSLLHSETLESAAAALPRATAHPVDLLDVGYVDDQGAAGTRTCLNMASCGVSGLVCRLVNDSRKRLGGTATFFLSTLRAQAQYTAAPVRVELDDAHLGDFTITTLAGANGRWAGGGMMFTPDARLDDGLLDVCILEEQSILRSLDLARFIYDGRHGDRPGVHLHRGRRLQVTPLDPGLPAWVEVDGEAPGRAPMTVTVRPRPIRLRGVRPELLAGS